MIELEKERERQSPQIPKPAPPKAREMRSLAGNTVVVKRFVFKGNTHIASDVLLAELATYIGRPLEFLDLKAAATAAAEFYRSRGWVVRAILPEQDITDGEVVIEIFESRLGDVRLRREPGLPPLVSDAVVMSITQATLPRGSFIRAGDLDRAISLVDDLPGVGAQGTLYPGSEDSTSDLLLTLTGKPRLSGQLALENHGSRSTGAERFMATLAIASPLEIGDQIMATGMATRGSRYARLAYAVPVGPHGMRVSTYGTSMQYRLVGRDFEALQSEGSSTTAGVELSYPLIRAKAQTLALTLGYEWRGFTNQALGNTTSEYSVQAVNLGLSFTRRDQSLDVLGGLGGNWNTSAGIVAGRVNLGGSPNQQADADGARTAGAYRKFKWSFARSESFSERVWARLSLSGQFTPNNLDSSEKFLLGGPSGVRGYPGGEASGSEGVLASFELGYDVAQHWKVSGFVDQGSIKVHRKTYASAPQPNRYSLQSAGMSLTWDRPGGLSFALVVSRRMGSNPAQSALGKDSDGTRTENRIWTGVKFSF